MEIVELTPRTWPALEKLFSANKTVGGCWCCWFLRPAKEVDARRRGLAAALLEAAVDWARKRGAVSVEGHPVDTEGERRGSGDLYHGTLAMFLSAGFDLVDRRGTRRALVRRAL